MPKPKTRLSDRARAVLNFLVSYKCAHDGNSPSLREIGDQIGVSSTSLLDYYLKELETAGYIRPRKLWRARQIHLVGGEYSWKSPEVADGRTR